MVWITNMILDLPFPPISSYISNYLQYWCVFAVIVLVSRYYLVNRRFYQLASKIPGNRAWPIIGNGLDFMADLTEILNVLEKLVTKFGGTAKAWLGPYLIVIVTRPEDLEVYYNHPKLMDKGYIYEIFMEILGQGLLTSGGEMWKRHRRLISPTFRSSVLKTFVDIFWSQCKTLTTLLDKKIDSNKSFDIFPYIRNCTFDFISETAMESPLEVQRNTIPHITEAAESLMTIMTKRASNVLLHPSWLFSLTPYGVQQKKAISTIRTKVFEIIEEKKREFEFKKDYEDDPNEEIITKKTFLNQFLELHEEDSLTNEELYDEIINIIVAGYETSAGTTSFLLLMLGIHQDIQEKVYAEIMSVKEEMQGDIPQAEDLKKLVYTEMVIKETLRMFPVAPLIARKCADDVQIGKYMVPKGADVIAFSVPTHRDPAIWNEPNKFNPDNFLPENVAKRHPYSFVPFAAGLRNCIGQRYAMLSMKVMIFAIISKYKLFSDLKLEDIVLRLEVTLKCANDFMIRLEPRKPSHQKRDENLNEDVSYNYNKKTLKEMMT